MKVSQQLRLIQKISGETQEALARRFEVTFAAYNAWVNNRAVPRPAKQKLIEDFYRELTGQKVIPTDVLEAKKQIIASKSKKFPNSVNFINKNSDVRDQLSLSLTYNTNQIEGSTMTEQDTAAVIFHNTALPNRTLVEQLEAKNHQTALNFIFERAKNDDAISESLILQLHRILMNGIVPDAGEYRQQNVRIVGANVPTANFLKIPELMRKMLAIIKKKKEIVAKVSKIHAHFEQIHPFSDGNGRIGRLLIQAMLLEQNIAPAIIEQKKKNQYYSCLNVAQIKEDLTQLEDFLCEAILAGFDIMERKQIS